MANEIVEARLDGFQASLPKAVKATDGAHFRMLLSMISSNQSFDYLSSARERSSGDFALPDSAPGLKYPEAEQLYSKAVVDRINRSFNKDARGDFAYAVSWVDTQANMPEGFNALGDSLAKLAMGLNAKLMIAEVGEARSTIRATA